MPLKYGRRHWKSLQMAPFDRSYPTFWVCHWGIALPFTIFDIYDVQRWTMSRPCEIIQGHWKWHHSIDRIEFLLALHSNCGYFLYRFRDKARYRSITAIFHTPAAFAVPIRGSPTKVGWEIMHTLSCQGYQDAVACMSNFIATDFTKWVVFETQCMLAVTHRANLCTICTLVNLGTLGYLLWLLVWICLQSLLYSEHRKLYRIRRYVRS